MGQPGRGFLQKQEAAAAAPAATMSSATCTVDIGSGPKTTGLDHSPQTLPALGPPAQLH